jgi:hypothetical protein
LCYIYIHQRTFATEALFPLSTIHPFTSFIFSNYVFESSYLLPIYTLYLSIVSDQFHLTISLFLFQHPHKQTHIVTRIVSLAVFIFCLYIYKVMVVDTHCIVAFSGLNGDTLNVNKVHTCHHGHASSFTV